MESGNSEFSHQPVLLQECLDILAPKPGETVLDVTLGLGGHAGAFLSAIGEKGKLIGVDTDMENLTIAKKNLASHFSRITFHHGNFRDLQNLGISSVDIVFADLGLSSPHIDDGSRGFSFRTDGPLDLRFDRENGETAAELLERLSEEEVATIFWKFGEIKESRKLARIIKELSPKTTWVLKEVTERAFGYRAKKFLPQVFQALRIAVNDELGALETLLSIGPKLLNPGGRMGIMSYHSLEDRMVKQTFKMLSTPEKNLETGKIAREAPFRLLTKKPIRPSSAEIEKNPRSRSALLRVLEKVSD